MSLTKRTTSASMQLTLSNGLVRMASILTMPILTRLLTPSAYGIAAMSGNFVALISVIGLAGIDMSYVRSYHSKSGPSGSKVEVFAWQWILIVGALFGAVLFLCWQPIARLLNLPNYLGGLLGGGIILSLVNTMSQARARLNNRYREMSVALFASSIGVIVISILVAYSWKQNELPLILAMLAGYGIPIIILGIPLPNKLCQSSYLSPSEKVSFVKIGLAGTITAPAYWLISSSDRWFLGYLMDSSSVGIYSMAYSVGIFGMMVNNALLSVWTTEAAKEFEYNPDNARNELGKTVNYIVAAYICVWVVVSALGGEIVRLLASSAFHDAAELIPFIAGAVLFHGIIHLFNTSLLLINRLVYAIRWWLIGGIISIALNILLIPSFGRLGAAVTQALTLGIIATGILYAAQKYYPLRLNWWRIVTCATLALVAVGFLQKAWNISPLNSILYKVPVLIFVLALIAQITLPMLFLMAKKRLRKMLKTGN